ncbi:MAG TPA: ABC transporter ATP-binding protein [Alphaproteobacteria bacterium]|jgi:branched-chain amino acid transport system ATP-binding protein|nr:ABC transporter ATP-binding protein [Alphaproteobacteria bacterium]
MLRLDNISASYGAVRALDDVSLSVGEGEIVTLIGANGAGKSTLLMAVCGNPRPRSGSVWLKGRDITGLPTHQIAALGVAHAPEGRRIFARMTVRENLQLGARLVDPARFGPNLDAVVALFPRLKERLEQRGGTLSGGEQQMLAIGRAMMGEPELLLLDEPSLGLAPLLVQQIFAAIGRINRERRMSILIVEQNAHHALKLAHRGYVLVTGKVTLQGPAAELAANPEIRAAYLGG